MAVCFHMANCMYIQSLLLFCCGACPEAKQIGIKKVTNLSREYGENPAAVHLLAKIRAQPALGKLLGFWRV